MKIIKTANYKKMAQEIGNNRKELALRLLDWHGGQSSPLYSVGSSWLAGKEVPTENIEAAIDELQTIVKKKVNYPDAITDDDIVAVQQLQEDLRKAIKIDAVNATHGIWKDMPQGSLNDIMQDDRHSF
jgi:hypothetical protein